MTPSIAEFQTIILDYYRQEGRSFPWRDAASPWGILVSEVMLQQTQTNRVEPYWERWLSLWPTAADLAAAPLDQVLREWSGLGYNRRARFLREAAINMVENHGGQVPASVQALEDLPGIGPYTARAVATFAFGAAEVFIETNIRSVFLHFYFPGALSVPDKELLPRIEQTLDRTNPRRWYWALMDYGARLKKITANPSRRSSHHTRQSRFEGSLRQARGQVIRTLARLPEGASLAALQVQCSLEAPRLAAALASLAKESLVAEKEGVYYIP